MNYEPSTTNQFASRGGLKLRHAIENFKLKIENFTVLDVGSSTGGFVDCLLQYGAKQVYSVDTAYGELAWKLRNDPRVIVMERTNILHLKELPNVIAKNEVTKQSQTTDNAGSWSSQDDNPKVDLITIDASWTKLELILPMVKPFLKENGYIIALLKPHYEANKQMLVKGILPEDQLEKVVNNVYQKIENLKFKIKNSIESPILGGGGNKEYLLLLIPET